MRLEEILQTYITPIKRFETIKPDFTGKDVYEYYRGQAKVHDIEPFTTLRFQAKFKNFVETQEQYEYLNQKTKEINQLAQRLFEKKFPKYYTEDPNSKFRNSLEE